MPVQYSIGMYKVFHICNVHPNTTNIYNIYSDYTHTHTYIYVTGMKIGLGKRQRFRAFIVFGVLVWMQADVQMNHGSSNVHAQWFSHWKIRVDNHDIIK